MPYAEGHFDKIYAIEATVHSPTLYSVYSEVFRVLKPGGLFALYEWIMTDKYNPTDPYHKKLKADILVSVSPFVFTARRSYASAVLGVVILSVRLYTRAL